MDIRGTSNKQSPYPTGQDEAEKKQIQMRKPSNAQPVTQGSEGSSSPPRMSSRRAQTKIPRNPREKAIPEASSDSSSSTAPRQELVAGTASKSPAAITASASEVTSQAASERITFSTNDEIFAKLRNPHGELGALMFKMVMKEKQESINKKVEDLTKTHELLKKKSAQPLNTDDHLLKLGQEELKTWDSTRDPVFPAISDLASCVWLAEATINCGEDKLKAFFELAIGFRKKGIDLPSVIVNSAITSGNYEFLKRLNDVYPNTSLEEYFQKNI